MAARKRKAAKRELINTGSDKRYVRRKAVHRAQQKQGAKETAKLNGLLRQFAKNSL